MELLLCIQIKKLLLWRIWRKMTEDQIRLLAVFEDKVRKLMAECDQHKKKIQELSGALESKDEELQQAMQMIRELNVRYDSMLTARVVSVNKQEVKNAKMRLSKLVQEVDRCIALLNE
jgi:uncharacterized membrane protein